MKIITGNNLSVLKGDAKKKSDRATSEPSQGAVASKPTASSTSIVHHSGLDRIVRLVRNSAEEGADPRLEEIRLAIEEGRYKISSDDIADAMIRETLTISGIEK